MEDTISPKVNSGQSDDLTVSVFLFTFTFLKFIETHEPLKNGRHNCFLKVKVTLSSTKPPNVNRHSKYNFLKQASRFDS